MKAANRLTRSRIAQGHPSGAWLPVIEVPREEGTLPNPDSWPSPSGEREGAQAAEGDDTQQPAAPEAQAQPSAKPGPRLGVSLRLRAKVPIIHLALLAHLLTLRAGNALSAALVLKARAGPVRLC